MSSSASLSQGVVATAAAGVTGAYDGKSLAWKFLIAFFAGLTIYNAIELIIVIFVSFTRYRGVYFWSLLVSSIGLIPYALGFSFKFFSVFDGNAKYLSVTLLTLGWWAFLTGSNVVLWSRLHIIVTGERGDRILRYTKWMIIIDAIIFHLPTTVVTFGSNGDLDTAEFVHAYNVVERFQMTGFFIQEIILSSTYIVETTKILRQSLRPKTSRLMYQLVLINIAIIIMDTGLLSIEYASLYLLETMIKGFTYSLKLKLEFAILSRLVKFVGGDGTREGSIPTVRSRSMTFVDPEKAQGPVIRRTETHHISDISEFVDLSKVKTDYRYACPRESQSIPQSRENKINGIDILEDNARY